MRLGGYLPRDPARTPTPRYGLMKGQSGIEINGVPGAEWTRSAHASPLSDIRLLAPAEPSKIVCVGRNYAAHAAELGNELPKDRKSTRLNSSHGYISYAVFCLKKKKKTSYAVSLQQQQTTKNLQTTRSVVDI